MKTLYALLIGINKYATKPLLGPKNDVSHIKKHLRDLEDKGQFKLSLQILLNEEATKSKIVDEISKLSNVSSDDIVLIYFSGHGTEEPSGGLFKNAYSGKIQGIVCSETDKKKNDAGFNILADKEIRFLMSRFVNEPQIVTVFDCCHSGEITKNSQKNQLVTKSKIYQRGARNYSEFIFSPHIEEDDLRNSTFIELFGIIKNHIHLGACLPTELSFETFLPDPFNSDQIKKQGVFTKYLLDLLISKNSNIRYCDIATWANIYFQVNNSSKQTPQIKSYGSGNNSIFSNWLDLDFEDNLRDGIQMYHNKIDGWFINRGAIWGININDKVFIEEQNIEGIVTKVFMDKSHVDIDDLDRGRLEGYQVSLPSSRIFHCKSNIYINDLDENDIEFQNSIIGTLKDIGVVDIVSSKGEANFYLNIFSKTVYFTFAEDEFVYKPFARQYDLLSDGEGLNKFLCNQLQYIGNWNIFKQLQNQNHPYNYCPISVEFLDKSISNPQWIKLFHGCTKEFVPKNIHDKRLYSNYQLRIKRIDDGSYPLYVGAYLLWSDMQIDNQALDVVELNANDDYIYFYGDTNNEPYLELNSVFDLYNWSSERAFFNFIVSETHFNLNIFSQRALAKPHHPFNLTATRGTAKPLDLSAMVNPSIPPGSNEKWQVYTMRIDIINPNYNVLRFPDEIKANQNKNGYLINPFLEKLYPNLNKMRLG